MPPVTVGELQVILSGDLSRLDRDMDRIDNRAGATEKVHTAAWKRTGNNAGQAIRAGMLSAERDADKIGDRTGGVLAQGIRSGMIRRSPLIAAAIGGALIAGAPLVMAGVAALFAGVGAAAAAQTVEVRSAWTKLGKDVRDGAVADAAVLVPVYVGMAEQIGDAFQDMRPQLREAFADSAPLIQSTTDGVIALGSNAMPGLVRAIAAGGPVFDGLEDFLASTGTGVTGLLDAISGHSPAAGAAFASLGDIVGDLLPILGELLGQGAELAADVLPAVAAATGLTLDVLQLLGPLLPSIVAGFVAFKVAQTAAGYLQTFAVQAQYATTAMTGSVTAGAKVGGVLSGLGKSLPVVGIAVGVVSAAMAQGEAQIDGWARALLEGGAAARVARQEIADVATSAEDMASGWSGAAMSFLGAGVGVQASAIATGEALDMAKERADALKDAMSPLQRAEQDVTTATNNLSEQIDRYGEGSNEAEGAARELEAAERERERQSGALEQAIHGVTSAMIEQADQAMAALDSGFAYRNSLDQLEDAQAALNTAIAEQGAGSEAAQRAQLGLEEQAYRTALAFGQQQADLTGLSSDSLEYKRIVQEEMLAELQRLHDAAGPEMKAAIAAQIAALQAGGVAVSASANLASVLTGQVRGLSGSIQEVPGQKFVKIDAPTGPQIQQMKDLGYQVVNLPNGDVYVAADTADAEAAMNYAARKRQSLVEQVFVQTNRPMTGAFAATGGGIEGGRLQHFDIGGPVRGPGGPTSDLVPAMLSNGEHIWTAAETHAAGGHSGVAALRRAVLAANRAGSHFSPNSRNAAAAGTGSGSVGGVTKIYNLRAAVTHTITLPEFINLQKQAEALYG